MTNTGLAIATDETSPGLDAAAAEQAGVGDPIWVRDRRQEAWDLFESTPMPSVRSEEWRYTNLDRMLDLAALVP